MGLLLGGLAVVLEFLRLVPGFVGRFFILGADAEHFVAAEAENRFDRVVDDGQEGQSATAPSRATTTTMPTTWPNLRIRP